MKALALELLILYIRQKGFDLHKQSLYNIIYLMFLVLGQALLGNVWFG